MSGLWYRWASFLSGTENGRSQALFRIAIVLLKAHSAHLSKAVDHADAMDLLCPINPLATRVPINDNDMLTKAFKLSLARKQFSVSLCTTPSYPVLDV